MKGKDEQKEGRHPEEEWDYEGGLAQAPHPVKENSPSKIADDGNELQSVHVDSTKMEGIPLWRDRSRCRTVAFGENGSEILKKTIDAPRVAKKKVSQPGSLGGKTLGECGPVLQQLLLEVLPLCSQPMGKVNSRSVFPLPTSRDILVACFPDLTPDEVSWCLCLTMSLNSLWGNELLSHRMPSATQRRCLEGLVADVRRLCSISECVQLVGLGGLFLGPVD